MSTAVIKKKKKKEGEPHPLLVLHLIPARFRWEEKKMFPKCLESWPDSADPASPVEVGGLLRPFPRRERRRLPISLFPTPSTDPQSASAGGAGSQAVPNGPRRFALAAPLSDRSVDFATIH